MDMEKLHALKVVHDGGRGQIELDGFAVDGVLEYEVKCCAGRMTELSLRMLVKSINKDSDRPKLTLGVSDKEINLSRVSGAKVNPD